MKSILFSFVTIALLGCSVSSSFDPRLCPDANRVAASDRREFECAVAEASYIFVGTLVEIDDSWKPGAGLATSCANMEFAVDRVVVGAPPSRRLVLEHYMYGPEIWVEQQKNKGLRLSPQVFQPGQQYIVVGDSRYRFCGKDSIGTIWVNTPSNLHAVMEAIPIPVAEASDPPTVDRRDPLPYWRWRFNRPEFTGIVGLSGVVTQSGYPARIAVTHPLVPGLDRDVAMWVRHKWHFQPALRGDRPVPVEVALSVQVVNGVPSGMN